MKALFAAAILLAAAANAAQRTVFAGLFGSRAFALRFAAVSGLALLAGLLAFALARLA